MSRPLIQITNLSISLAGNHILHDLSLDITEGEYVSIIGPNGAGKTTLIKCLAGIHTNWTGSIQVSGHSFRDLPGKQRAKLQSYVPQAEGRPNPLTVEEFVATGRYPHLSAFTSMQKEDFDAIDRELDRAGLRAFRKRLMSSLSGGERQMAFIAAALVQETPIILLDEPSTFLDYRHQADVTAILRSACSENGKTVVAVHHDINTAAACSDRIHAIKAGRVVFSGTPEAVANSKTLEAVFDTPFICTPTPTRPLPFIESGGRS